jgi:hypothetical protein
MRVFASILSAIVILGFSDRASGENSGREFLMSCTYGVLAGTLVGAASLAFVDKPGDNLNHVARGASLGLYTGIFLGLYVIYIVPGLEGNPDEDPLVTQQNRRFDVLPLFSPKGLDGAQASWTLTRF